MLLKILVGLRNWWGGNFVGVGVLGFVIGVIGNCVVVGNGLDIIGFFDIGDVVFLLVVFFIFNCIVGLIGRELLFCIRLIFEKFIIK